MTTINPPTATPVPVGLVGFGLAGHLLHGPLIEAVPGLRLAKVVTSRTEQVRGRFPEAEVVERAEAMWADPEIDVVVIATPNGRHAGQARAALQAGKHVVVDKPFVVDPAQGEALVTLAREQSRLLTVFQNRRWDADFLTVEHLLQEKRLGEVLHVELCWDRFRPQIKPGWRETLGQGTGLLADLGPHLVDQAQRLFGWPERVSAELLAQRPQAEVDDYFSLTLHYGSARVHIASSTLMAAPRPRFALHGTKGSFVKYGLDPQEASLRALGRPTDPGFGLEAPEAYGTLTLADEPPTKVPSQIGRWLSFYEEVATAVQRGGPPPVDPREAIAGLRLLSLARQSAAQGCVLAFDSKFAVPS